MQSLTSSWLQYATPNIKLIDIKFNIYCSFQNRYINKVEIIFNNSLAIILLLFGFIIKSLVAIININYKILPNLSDVGYYNELGVDFTRDLAIQGGVIGAPLYGNILGAVYYLLGTSSANVCLINVFLY